MHIRRCDDRIMIELMRDRTKLMSDDNHRRVRISPIIGSEPIFTVVLFSARVQCLLQWTHHNNATDFNAPIASAAFVHCQTIFSSLLLLPLQSLL